MRVLVSGSSGLIGGAVVQRLAAEGDTVVRFDIADGHDVLNAADYATMARGCDAIVHAAGGHRPDATDPGERFITHNVTGNWNMLEAARQAGIRRVVTFSSVNALGVFRGEAPPDYLPIDDDHPIRPPTARQDALNTSRRARLIPRQNGRRIGSTAPGSTCAMSRVRCSRRCDNPH
jgi:nucleoside-diphosphate-sugar epimerase